MLTFSIVEILAYSEETLLFRGGLLGSLWIGLLLAFIRYSGPVDGKVLLMVFVSSLIQQTLLRPGPFFWEKSRISMLLEKLKEATPFAPLVIRILRGLRAS